MAKVVIRAEAVADIAGIHTTGQEEFGRSAANSYLDGLEQALVRLETYPLIGPLYPGLRPPIRYLSYRRHHIFYDTDGTTVWIVRVLHHAQDAASLL